MHHKNVFVNLKKYNKPVILRNVGTWKLKVMVFAQKKIGNPNISFS